jgi:selenide, water dikinase
LAQVLRHLPASTDPNLLVGFSTSDDAGVYRLLPDLALVQTVDFFTPIVDDPYDFGRVAAANSLSDIYAMGARPIVALNIATFPVETLPLEDLGRILQGGAAVAASAGVTILGGHTVKDVEPKYGMAVTGTVHPDRIVTNAGARPGDTLLLTKPLGTGILSTALKRNLIDDARMAPVIEWMVALNAHASHSMIEAGARAATDITGYGLLGHAGEMARASGVRLRLDAHAVPLHDGILDLIERGVVPGGTKDNADEQAGYTHFAAGVDAAHRVAFSDAQTSGGLLIAIAPDRVETLRALLRTGPALDAVVGRVEEGSGIIVGDSTP